MIIALAERYLAVAHGFPFLELVRNDSAGKSHRDAGGLHRAINSCAQRSARTAVADRHFRAVRFGAARSSSDFLSMAFVVSAAARLRDARQELLSRRRLSDDVCGGRGSLLEFTEGSGRDLGEYSPRSTARSRCPLVLPLYPPAKAQVSWSSTCRSNCDRSRSPASARRSRRSFRGSLAGAELASAVGNVYASLPPAERAKAAIFAERYGEAAAIDIFGTRSSAGNQRQQSILPLGAAQLRRLGGDRRRRRSRRMAAVVQLRLRVVARYGASPYVMPSERKRPIVLCKRLASAASAALAAPEVLRN